MMKANRKIRLYLTQSIRIFTVALTGFYFAVAILQTTSNALSCMPLQFIYKNNSLRLKRSEIPTARNRDYL